MTPRCTWRIATLGLAREERFDESLGPGKVLLPRASVSCALRLVGLFSYDFARELDRRLDATADEIELGQLDASKAAT
jgi:hypothetical protein